MTCSNAPQEHDWRQFTQGERVVFFYTSCYPWKKSTEKDALRHSFLSWQWWTGTSSSSSSPSRWALWRFITYKKEFEEKNDDVSAYGKEYNDPINIFHRWWRNVIKKREEDSWRERNFPRLFVLLATVRYWIIRKQTHEWSTGSHERSHVFWRSHFVVLAYISVPLSFFALGNLERKKNREMATNVKYQPLDPDRMVKPPHVKALKVFCLMFHIITIGVYTTATICFMLGVMAHSDPVKLKTGHKYLDLCCVRFNPLMTEERVFITIIMFVGILLTTYDMTCIWVDDLHLVTNGRFPEQMIFMFLVKMFAGMFLFTPRYLQVYWIRTGAWIILFAVPRLMFTAQIGILVKKEVRKEM